MKQALIAGDRIELRGFGVFTVKPARPASDAIRAPAPRSASPGKAVRSSPEKNAQDGRARRIAQGSFQILRLVMHSARRAP